ncbi:heme-degrading domain-containing protein [Granulicella paludicola]|uniref:heme-degrading domain-containing protein n=1 Tax=Granulicella paludicola TaxID=474951 RepID=UPI0021E0B695|nr:heme-degrading domain-containing protein [Granulicella paludicola]
MSNPAADLALITQQENLLRFPSFNADVAWQLGSLLRSKLTALNAGGTVEVDLAGHILFTAVTLGPNGLATPGQADWVRRKRNVVRRFGTSSYAVGRKLELNNQTLEARHGLFLSDYATDGGGFPIVIAGSGLVGSVIVSGLVQREDHSLAVTAISELLNIPVPTLP